MRFTNPELFKTNIEKFCENEDIMWDVLIIGGNNVPPYKQYYDYCARVYNCQTTTGYIVKQEFYDVMIKNFKEGVTKLMRDPNNKRMYAIDIYWKKLQMENFGTPMSPVIMNLHLAQCFNSIFCQYQVEIQCFQI